jgi:hypothetical protein
VNKDLDKILKKDVDVSLKVFRRTETDHEIAIRIFDVWAKDRTRNLLNPKE